MVVEIYSIMFLIANYLTHNSENISVAILVCLLLKEA
jgi:hypothetical protein